MMNLKTESSLKLCHVSGINIHQNSATSICSLLLAARAMTSMADISVYSLQTTVTVSHSDSSLDVNRLAKQSADECSRLLLCLKNGE